MNCLGIYGRTLEPGRSHTVHDAGVSLFVDGRHTCSLQQERVSRLKTDDTFPLQAAEAVLRASGMTPGQLDGVAMAQTPPMLSLDRSAILSMLNGAFPNAEIDFVGHHQAHAAATFLASGFDRATVLSFDGGGDHFPPFSNEPIEAGWRGQCETMVLAVGDRASGLRQIHQARSFMDDELLEFPLGLFFDRMSLLCYLKAAPERASFMLESADPGTIDQKVYSDLQTSCPGKIMGLQAYGDASKVQLPAPFGLRDDGFGMPVLHSQGWASAMLKGEALPKEVDQHLQQCEPADLAAWLQKAFEDALIAYLKYWPMRESKLCLAGGCALNVLANRKILDLGLFEDLYVFPGANDSGLCVGAAAWASFVRGHRNIQIPVNAAALGVSYPQPEIQQAIEAAGLTAVTLASHSEVTAKAVEILASGRALGWHQGRSEFGPRALGMRSILADARRADIKDHLNQNVKNREWWRPYAPVVLEEHAQQWFDIDRPSPYMLLSAKVRPDKREQVPGIVHEDGTARVQTVNRRQNALLYELLVAFEQQTGVPMLLNTSFNVAGEPIVESPADAIKTYQACALDALAMGLCVLEKM